MCNAKERKADNEIISSLIILQNEDVRILMSRIDRWRDQVVEGIQTALFIDIKSLPVACSASRRVCAASQPGSIFKCISRKKEEGREYYAVVALRDVTHDYDCHALLLRGLRFAFHAI